MRNSNFEVVLIEDNIGDIELIQSVFQKFKRLSPLHVFQDGETAIAYLQQTETDEFTPIPDLILLDLNLPGMSGPEILQSIKEDKRLKQIPVIVFTTSDANEEIIQTYHLGANAYITKPLKLQEFTKILKSIEQFWFTIVKLPPRY